MNSKNKRVFSIGKIAILASSLLAASLLVAIPSMADSYESIEWTNTDPDLPEINDAAEKSITGPAIENSAHETRSSSASGTIYVNNGTYDDPIEDDGDGDESVWKISGATITTTVEVLNGGRLEMTNCNILNVPTGVIFHSGSSGFIRDSTITTTSSSGANIDSVGAVDNIEISNNILNGDAEYGILIDDRSENWQIKGNDISGHSRGIMARKNYCNDISHTIDNNYIHDNEYGVKLYGIARGSSQIRITNFSS